MSKSIKDALIEARECPNGGILIFEDGEYTVEELPDNAVLIVPPSGALPIALTREGQAQVDDLVRQFVQGRLARAPGKKIKRRI